MTRKRIDVGVSDEAHEAWRLFAKAHGVSVAALVEVIGPALGDGSLSRQRLVSEARRVDGERRARPGR